jgi:hypothetical protein
MKLDLKKLATGALKIAAPVVIGAVLTKTSVKKAAIDAARDDLAKRTR